MVQIALEVALAFDLFDNGGIEPDTGVKQEIAPIYAASVRHPFGTWDISFFVFSLRAADFAK